MAHYDLEEQEQIDSLKTWWKLYGNLITGLVTAVALIVVGWQGWNWYQGSQSAKASAVYASLEQSAGQGDLQKVKVAAGELAEKYGRTGYAPLGAMVAARLSFDAGDLKTAKVQLAWVADNSKDELRDLARHRLAAILLDEKAFDEALKQLEAPRAMAFDARFLELKGDVLSAQGKVSDAKAAYVSALQKLDEKQAAVRELIQQKLDSLGGAA